VYQAGTLSGNPVAMAAGIAQLTECLKPKFYENLEKKTKIFVEGISKQSTVNSKQSTASLKVFSIGSIFWIAFTDKEKIQSAEEIDPNSMQHFRKLYHELLEQGIYLGPSGYEVGFVSEAHTEEVLMKASEMISGSLRKI
jgi:glutamate-1-semialdehyde 2,1-aminomutase